MKKRKMPRMRIKMIQNCLNLTPLSYYYLIETMKTLKKNCYSILRTMTMRLMKTIRNWNYCLTTHYSKMRSRLNSNSTIRNCLMTIHLRSCSTSRNSNCLIYLTILSCSMKIQRNYCYWIQMRMTMTHCSKIPNSNSMICCCSMRRTHSTSCWTLRTIRYCSKKIPRRSYCSIVRNSNCSIGNCLTRTTHLRSLKIHCCLNCLILMKMSCSIDCCCSTKTHLTRSWKPRNCCYSTHYLRSCLILMKKTMMIHYSNCSIEMKTRSLIQTSLRNCLTHCLTRTMSCFGTIPMSLTTLPLRIRYYCYWTPNSNCSTVRNSMRTIQMS